MNAVPPLSSLRLPEEAESLIRDEEGVCSVTIKSLKKQLTDQIRRFDRERTRARDLTETLVASRRDEERAQVASDEAVSHALAHQHDDVIESLKSLEEKPYFGRVVLEEEDEASGVLRTIEYKIGYASNPDCRIIDWRKAPLSKLYYEYKEGEDYCEVIQGRERIGTVALRNRVEIVKGELMQVDNRLGSFRRITSKDGGSEWVTASAAKRAHQQRSGEGAESGANNDSVGRDFGSLPDILSLITPEQFSTITHDASSAVLLQGVAGSGKTTVALHRLSWLLAQSELRIAPSDVVVLTLGPSLSQYIKSTLPRLEISGVPVYSFREWCSQLIASLLPRELLVESVGGANGSSVVRVPVLSTGHLRPPSAIERAKRSVGLLLTLEEKAKAFSVAGSSQSISVIDLVLAALVDARRVVALDNSKLLSESLVRDAYDRTKEMVARGTLDRSDYSLLLRAAQLLKRVPNNFAGSLQGARVAGPFKHVVIDEVQDYSPIELAVVLSTLVPEGSLTLVGDVSQRTEDGFPGWSRLQGWWAERKKSSSFVKLDVSHRCTREIMRCASMLGDPSLSPASLDTAGRAGPKPRWLQGVDSDQALEGLIDWIHARSTEEPNALLAVVGFSAAVCRELKSLLTPSFGPAVRLLEDGEVSFEEGVLIGEAASLKGLEFYGVAVWEPSSKVVPNGQIGANLLYVAATRAQEHLAFITSGRSATALSRLPSAVLQRVELESAERVVEENPFAIAPLGDAQEKGPRRSRSEES